jgi:hypothetical protein
MGRMIGPTKPITAASKNAISGLTLRLRTATPTAPSIQMWMNKLINKVTENGLANPVNFRRSVNKVMEELLRRSNLTIGGWSLFPVSG